MINQLKKNGFSVAIARRFTGKDCDAFDLIHFKEPTQSGDEKFPALACPDNWGSSAAELFADVATYEAAPLQLHPVEENTVPSWLWRRTHEGKKTVPENSVKQVMSRVIGSATYKGWKESLFADEATARTFYDECCYTMTQRMIALEPSSLRTIGLDWAYGIKRPIEHQNAVHPKAVRDIPNALIDAVVSGSRDKHIHNEWQKLLTPKANINTLALRFSDVSADWGTTQKPPLLGMLDLMALRHNNGLINIDALRHATRLLVILLDLQNSSEEALAIGFCNLAPLLMALAIPYDSKAGRTIAAALSALITAEAFAVSSELAGLRGVNPAFTANREVVLRSLRNHRRAAYGDKNDYEKISVIPVPLGLQDCPDLTLVAGAQRRWDEVLDLVKTHGLRHIKVTALSSSPSLNLYMESLTSGIEPLRSLITLREKAEDQYQSEIAPFVCEALTRLGYNRERTLEIVGSIAGKGSLAKSPGINHSLLFAKGFDQEALDQIEHYLPFVNDVRLAITPYVVGLDFCAQILKIARSKIEKPNFDLLTHLGFKPADITAANKDYYGTHRAREAKQLKSQDLPVFALKEDITAEAKIGMAAAVQSFISGDVGLNLTLSPHIPIEKSEKLILNSWRQGIKTLTLAFDMNDEQHVSNKKAKTSMATFLHTQKRPSLPTRTTAPKAGSRLVSLKSSSTIKSSSKNKLK